MKKAEAATKKVLQKRFWASNLPKMFFKKAFPQIMQDICGRTTMQMCYLNETVRQPGHVLES